MRNPRPVCSFSTPCESSPVRCSLLAALAVAAQEPEERLAISLEPLGDNDAGVVARITFRFVTPLECRPRRSSRCRARSSRTASSSATSAMRPRGAPRTVDRGADLRGRDGGDRSAADAAARGRRAAAAAHKTAGRSRSRRRASRTSPAPTDGAEAAFAEGVVPETVGAVRIRAPRRDVAPNLFIVNVDVLPPVKRVEFWVEGKKSHRAQRAAVQRGARPRQAAEARGSARHRLRRAAAATSTPTRSSSTSATRRSR